MRISTSLAASTSSAETHAGSDRPWVSLAMNSGPSVPCIVRYSTIAWVVARMWNSLNEVFRLVPRCPEVPKATRWSMFVRVGLLGVVQGDQLRDVDEVTVLGRESGALVGHGTSWSCGGGRATHEPPEY